MNKGEANLALERGLKAHDRGGRGQLDNSFGTIEAIFIQVILRFLDTADFIMIDPSRLFLHIGGD